MLAASTFRLALVLYLAPSHFFIYSHSLLPQLSSVSGFVTPLICVTRSSVTYSLNNLRNWYCLPAFVFDFKLLKRLYCRMELRTPSALYSSLRSNIGHDEKGSDEAFSFHQPTEDYTAQGVLESSHQPIHDLGIFGFNVTIPEYQPLRYPLSMPSGHSLIGAVKPITPPSTQSMALQPWYDGYGALMFAENHLEDRIKTTKPVFTQVGLNNVQMDHQTLPYIPETTPYETPYYVPVEPTQSNAIISTTRLDSQQYPAFLGDFLPAEESSVEGSSQRFDDASLPVDTLSRCKSVLPSSYAGSEISEDVGEKPNGSETGESERKQASDKCSARRKGKKSQKKIASENVTPVCGICGRTFERYYNYKSHLQTHNPARPYPNQCDYDGCVSRFTRKAELDRHKQSVRCLTLSISKLALFADDRPGSSKREEAWMSFVWTSLQPERYPETVREIMRSRQPF